MLHLSAAVDQPPAYDAASCVSRIGLAPTVTTTWGRAGRRTDVSTTEGETRLVGRRLSPTLGQPRAGGPITGRHPVAGGR